MDNYNTPYDRGSADSYYMRQPKPHKRDKENNKIYDLSHDEVMLYMKGYRDNDEVEIYKEYE